VPDDIIQSPSNLTAKKFVVLIKKEKSKKQETLNVGGNEIQQKTGGKYSDELKVLLLLKPGYSNAMKI
jgi:hypothetical protein